MLFRSLNSATLDAFVHKHVSVMLHVLMNLPLFLDNMRFLSHSVGNWHVLDVFHLTVLNALLLKNLWHLRYFQQSVARAMRNVFNCSVLNTLPKATSLSCVVLLSSARLALASFMNFLC